MTVADVTAMPIKENSAIVKGMDKSCPIVLLSVNPTETLVVSQVLLSIALPAPILTLIYFTRREDIMGVMVNKPATTWFASVFAIVILLLNLALIYSSLGGRL